MRFHRHRFVPFRVEHVRDVSLGQPGFPYTRVYGRCTRCPKVRLRRRGGTWHLTDLYERDLFVAPRPSLSVSQIDWLIALVERWELGASKRRVSSAVLMTLRAMRAELTKENDGAGA